MHPLFKMVFGAEAQAAFSRIKNHGPRPLLAQGDLT
jgi:hypothetical protein